LSPLRFGVRLVRSKQSKRSLVPYRFESDETLSEAFFRTAREQLEAAESSLTRDIDSDPIGAVHTARKSIKKERALLRLMRDGVDADERRRENTALRNAARRLSGPRDAEVVVATLDDLSERYAGQIPSSAFEAVRSRLGAHVAGAGANDQAGAAQAASELAASRTRILSWKLEHGGWAALDGGLSESYVRGRKAFARARRDASMENLHDWRKRAKDLWYQLRLLAPVCGEAVRGEARDLHVLCDVLGDDHDLAVLRQTLLRVGGEVATDLQAVLGLLDHRREELQAWAMPLGERVYAERRKAFRRRIHVCWRAGRAQMREARRHPPIGSADATGAAAAD
jgi:CHAD domain-containing protein